MYRYMCYACVCVWVTYIQELGWRLTCEPVSTGWCERTCACIHICTYIHIYIQELGWRLTCKSVGTGWCERTCACIYICTYIHIYTQELGWRLTCKPVGTGWCERTDECMNSIYTCKGDAERFFLRGVLLRLGKLLRAAKKDYTLVLPAMFAHGWLRCLRRYGFRVCVCMYECVCEEFCCNIAADMT